MIKTVFFSFFLTFLSAKVTKIHYHYHYTPTYKDTINTNNIKSCLSICRVSESEDNCNQICVLANIQVQDAINVWKNATASVKE